MASLKALLASKAFHDLPPDQQFELARRYPAFKALDPKHQGEMIYSAHSKLVYPEGIEAADKPRESIGFVPRLTSNLGSIVSAVNDPAQTLDSMVAAQVNTAKKAKQYYDAGDTGQAILHGIASMVPMFGPTAATTAQDFQEGRPGEAIANILTMLPMSPRARGLAEQVPVPDVRRSIAATKGAIKGGLSAAVDPSNLTRSGMGYAIGNMAGHPDLGLAMGALPEVVRGAVRGAREGVAKLPKPPMEFTPQTPVWEGLPKPEALSPVPMAMPEPPTALPSGRKPGGIFNQQPEPQPVVRSAPEWTKIQSTPEQPPVPYAPIEGQLPSGRTPGGLFNQKPMTPAMPPTPWTGMPEAIRPPQTTPKPAPMSPPPSRTAGGEPTTSAPTGMVGGEYANLPPHAVVVENAKAPTHYYTTRQNPHAAFAKDSEIAGFLNKKGVGKREFDAATPEQKNAWAVEANAKYKRGGMNAISYEDVKKLLGKD